MHVAAKRRKKQPWSDLMNDDDFFPNKPRLLPLCAMAAALAMLFGAAQPSYGRCIDEEAVESRIGGPGEVVPSASANAPRMTMPELVREAVRRSHAIGASKLLAEAAANDAEEARVAGHPQASLNGSFGHVGSSTPGVPNTSGAQGRAGLTVNMPLFDFGRINRLAEWRKQLAEAARLGELSAEEQIGLQTVSLVLERGRYRVQGQVYQQYSRKMSCLVQALETIVSADKGRASELVQARKTLQQVELSVSQTNSIIRQIEVRLSRFVGDALPVNDSIAVGLLKPPSLPELIDEAERSNEIAALDAQVKAGDNYARAVVAGQRPQVSWSVTGSKITGIDKSSSWFAGVNVNVPLYNAGNDYSAAAARKRAEATRLQRADALESRKFRMAEIHEQASSSFDRARRVTEVVRDSDRLRNFTLQQWQQLGRRSLFDVMGAEGEHYSLRVAYINALYDGQQATAMLWSLGSGVLPHLQ
jgi:adhesin transport system outer membrane protein